MDMGLRRTLAEKNQKVIATRATKGLHPPEEARRTETLLSKQCDKLVAAHCGATTPSPPGLRNKNWEVPCI